MKACNERVLFFIRVSSSLCSSLGFTESQARFLHEKTTNNTKNTDRNTNDSENNANNTNNKTNDAGARVES